MHIKVISQFIKQFILFRFRKKTDFNFLGFLFNSRFKAIFNNFLTKPTRYTDSWLDLFLFGLIKGYNLYLELRGTGYKFRLISNLSFFGLILRVGYSHLIYIKMIKTFRILFYNRFILCFYSSDLWSLRNQVNLIKLQKKINAYKGKGLFWKNSVLKLKKSTKLRF